MNNEESKLSKPISEEESQPSPQQTENTQPSATGSESRQQTSSSQSETRDLPSCSSSEEETGASGNETEKTSPEDMPEFVVGAKLSPVTEAQDSCSPSSTAGSGQVREQHSSVLSHTNSSKAQLRIDAKLTDILRTALSHRPSKDKLVSEKKSSADPSTELRENQSTSKSKEATSKSAYKRYALELECVNHIPVTTEPGADYYVPESMIKQLDDSANSLNEQDYSAKFRDILRTALRNRISKDESRSEEESSTNLADSLLEELIKNETTTFNIPGHVLEDMENESSSTSSELDDGQLTPELEFESPYLHLNIKFNYVIPFTINTEPGTDYYVPEPMISELDNFNADCTPDETSHEPEPMQTESRSEMNLAPTTEEDHGVILGENSLPSESETDELTDRLRESLNIRPEESMEESPEGSPTEKSENHSK